MTSVEWLKKLGYDMETIDELAKGTIEMPRIDIGILSRNQINDKKVLTYYDKRDTMIVSGGNGE